MKTCANDGQHGKRIGPRAQRTTQEQELLLPRTLIPKESNCFCQPGKCGAKSAQKCHDWSKRKK